MCPQGRGKEENLEPPAFSVGSEEGLDPASLWLESSRLFNIRLIDQCWVSLQKPFCLSQTDVTDLGGISDILSHLLLAFLLFVSLCRSLLGEG